MHRAWGGCELLLMTRDWYYTISVIIFLFFDIGIDGQKTRTVISNAKKLARFNQLSSNRCARIIHLQGRQFAFYGGHNSQFNCMHQLLAAAAAVPTTMREVWADGRQWWLCSSHVQFRVQSRLQSHQTQLVILFVQNRVCCHAILALSIVYLLLSITKHKPRHHRAPFRPCVRVFICFNTIKPTRPPATTKPMSRRPCRNCRNVRQTLAKSRWTYKYAHQPNYKRIGTT